MKEADQRDKMDSDDEKEETARRIDALTTAERRELLKQWEEVTKCQHGPFCR